MSLRPFRALSRLPRYLRLSWLGRLPLSLAGCVRNWVKVLFPDRPAKAPPKRGVKLALMTFESRVAPDDCLAVLSPQAAGAVALLGAAVPGVDVGKQAAWDADTLSRQGSSAGRGMAPEHVPGQDALDLLAAWHALNRQQDVSASAPAPIPDRQLVRPGGAWGEQAQRDGRGGRDDLGGGRVGGQ
jgi:hypothetical protein